MRPFLLVMCAAVLCVSTVHAAPPPLSFDRVAAGVSLQAAVYAPVEGPRSGGCLPQAWASYSVTSQMSLAGSVERDFSDHVTLAHAGARIALTPPPSHVQVGAGVDAVWETAHVPSWSASLRGAWVAAQSATGRDLLYVVGSAEYNVDQALTTYRAGLRVPLVGGR